MAMAESADTLTAIDPECIVRIGTFPSDRTSALFEHLTNSGRTIDRTILKQTLHVHLPDRQDDAALKRIKVIEIPHSDTPAFPLLEVTRALAPLLEPFERIVFHCQAGQSRSPAVMLAWLLSVNNGSGLSSLWQRIMKFRPIVSLNWGLALALTRLDPVCSISTQNAPHVPAIWLNQETLYWRRRININRITNLDM